MDLELLRTFLEVNRVRHFGRAADGLFISQAAVSARVKQLETLLDVRLFERSRREVTLTPEGTRLVRHADRLIHNWRQARQEVATGALGRQLAVGGSLRLWGALLQAWFERLRRAHPDLALTAESQTPDLLVRHLLDGVIDVAFMLEPPHLDILIVRPVAPLVLTLVASRPHLDADAALAGDYVMVDWGFAHAVEHRSLFPDAPEPRIRVGEASIALGHLRRLGGAAYLPSRMVKDDLQAGRLFPVEGAPAIEWTVKAAYPVRASRRLLIEEALEVFAGL